LIITGNLLHAKQGTGGVRLSKGGNSGSDITTR
jgi:hypothetical protein